MAALPRSTKRRDYIKKLRALGFDGPHSGTGDHPEFMRHGKHKIKIPNPHAGDIDVSLLSRILRENGIKKDEWTKA